MLKFELNLILQFLIYEVIMPKNIFLNHSPFFCHHMGFFISPQQNGVVERKNRHLVETAYTLLLHHKVPQRFWEDATLPACYLINCMFSPVLHDKIPYSILFPNQPLFCLPPRVFGCVCFVHIFTLGQDKLSAKVMKCAFLSYSRL